jgi:hypothetical protein
MCDVRMMPPSWYFVIKYCSVPKSKQSLQSAG